MDYIKLRFEQLSFFYDADDPDGCALGYEDAGKLLVACRDYVATGDGHIADLFPAGHPARMSWKAIKAQIDADKAQSETNAANRRGKKRTRKETTANESERHVTTDNDTERKITTCNDQERPVTTGNEKQRKTTDKNEPERAKTDKNGQKEPLTGQNRPETAPARAHTATATQDINNIINNKTREKNPDINSSSSKYTDQPREEDTAGWDEARMAAIQAGVLTGKTTTASFRASCRKYAPDCTSDWARAAVGRCVQTGNLTPRYLIGTLKGFQASGGIDTWPDGDGRRAGGRAVTMAKQAKTTVDPFMQFEQRPLEEQPESDVPQWLMDYRATHQEVA